MPETIYKYPVPLEDRFELELPPRAGVVHFAEQDGEVFVWVRLNPEARKETRTFYVRGTGHPLPEGRVLGHVGTCFHRGGEFVWHLFQDQGEAAL